MPPDDSDLRQSLGEAGRVYAEKHLDKEVVLSQFERDLCAVVE